MLVFALALLPLVVHGDFINGGTPKQIPKSFDCAARKAAWEFGKTIIPRHGDFRSLFDALQLENGCGLTPPTAMDSWIPPKYSTPTKGTIVYVDANHGMDSNPGTKDKALKTIAKAVQLTTGHNPATILLRAGTYFTDMIELNPSNSGLTIQNFEGEHATVSGGVPFTLSSTEWKPYNINGGWTNYEGFNNVYGRVPSPGKDGPGIKFLGKFDSFSECKTEAMKEAINFFSLTYHEPSFAKDWAKGCYGGTTDAWAPHGQANVISARNHTQNTWVADMTKHNIPKMLGLRLAGQRAIRAKYPDGNPELNGQYFFSDDPGMGNGQYTQGWVIEDTDWVKPARKPDATELVFSGPDWPSVIWPMAEEGGSKWTGEGDWGVFNLGMGGYCDDLDPPTGYWCSMHPPRGQCFDNKTMTSRGCTQTHMSPDGVHYANSLPHASNYSDPRGAVVHSWRGGGRWFTQSCLVSKHDASGKILHFDTKIGCNQGGEGEVGASQWWIDNVKEECDSPNEWFFDENELSLYYSFNGTAPPTGKEEWVATKTEVLFNVTGSQKYPVHDVHIKGLEIRDTAYTYLGTSKASIHGMPSGGDWALQRSGAVLFEGTERSMVDGCWLNRIDGNGIFISNYNRNTTLSNNDFTWIGDSAMAAWGSTSGCMNENCSVKIPYGSGPDGRGGNQPRNTHVVGNMVREIGIWQKQSSMWFQAVTAQTYLAKNVHFNGPRAGLNFNDGFGGGDIIEGNLLTNCVRESGDHGPWNSWDRLPYITNIGMARDRNSPTGHKPADGPSVIPTFRQIRKNFIMSVYSSQEGIDTDDGSSYYHTYNNFFLYASNGLKSDFGGQWNHHYNNVYGYVLSKCFGTGNNLAFYGNKCITFPKGYRSDCVKEPMNISDNAIYSADGTMSVCGTTLSKWVSEGHDHGTTIAKWPSDAELIKLGMNAIGTLP